VFHHKSPDKSVGSEAKIITIQFSYHFYHVNQEYFNDLKHYRSYCYICGRPGTLINTITITVIIPRIRYIVDHLLPNTPTDPLRRAKRTQRLLSSALANVGRSRPAIIPSGISCINSRRSIGALGLLLMATFIGPSLLTAPARASTVGITNAGALGAFDTINWSQIGPPFTTFSSPQSVVSAGGANASVSSAGNAFQILDQGPGGWTGNFAPGTPVLWDASKGPDITVSFANPVSGVGAQIQPDFWGNFTAQVTVYGTTGNVLGSFTEDGYSVSNDPSTCITNSQAICGANPAIFIGVADTSADISKVTFDLTSATLAPNDFAIGTLDFSGISPVPEPATWAMMIIGFLFLGFMGLRRKARNGAVAMACDVRHLPSLVFGISTIGLAATAQAENSRQTLTWQPYDNKDVLTDKVSHEVGSEVTFPDGNMVQAFARCGQDAVRQKYPGLTIVVGSFHAGNRQPNPFAWRNKAIQVPLLLNDQRRPDVHGYTEDQHANFIAVGFYDPAAAKRHTRLDEAPIMKLEALRAVAEMKQEAAWGNFVAGTGGTMAELLQATSIRVQLPLADASADAIEINPQDVVLKKYVQDCNAGLRSRSDAR
jgi:hypothetical protein